MSTTIPTTPPHRLIAGDTIKWSASHAGYSAADGWTLTYYIRGQRAFDVAAVADGTGWAVEIPAATTATYLAGRYRLIGRAELAGEIVTVYDAPLVVEPDPASTVVPVETRSHARRVLDALKAVIEGKATHDQLAYSVNGRQITKLTWDQLLAAKDHYAALVRVEEWSETGGGNVLIRFSNPCHHLGYPYYPYPFLR